MGSNSGDAEDGKIPQADAEPEAESDGFSKKLHDSAFGLVSDAFGGSGAAVSSLASAAGDEKGEASRGSSGPKDTSTWAQGGSRSSAPGHTSNNDAPHDGAFRSRLDQEASSHAQQELDGFQTTGREFLTEEQQAPYLGNGKGKDRETEVISGRSGAVDEIVTYERVWKENKSRRFPLHAALAEKEDGADVVALLSDPNFQPGLSYEETMEPADEDMESEDNPFELSPAEIQFIEKLKATLPPPDLHKPPLPSNPLNLIPDHGPANAFPSKQKSELLATTPLHIDESYLYHSSGTLSAAQQTGIGSEPIPGLEEWFEVINSYHEDVWGYLRPYVKAAKQEVERAEELGEPNATGGPAVRRLGMILAHLDEGFDARTRHRK